MTAYLHNAQELSSDLKVTKKPNTEKHNSTENYIKGII
jgi:hypothetical protein